MYISNLILKITSASKPKLHLHKVHNVHLLFIYHLSETNGYFKTEKQVFPLLLRLTLSIYVARERKKSPQLGLFS